MEGSAQHLRVLIANERQERLAVVAPLFPHSVTK